jgi:ethanolamine transporter EutH
MAINRAQGCWLGQLTGDALGSLVEFQSPVETRRLYPEGVRYLADGGTWGTIAGQPFGYLWGSLSLGNGGGVGPAGCCPHPSPSGVSAGLSIGKLTLAVPFNTMVMPFGLVVC